MTKYSYQPINWQTAKPHEKVTSVRVGDEIVTGNGVGIRIIAIEITDLHLHPDCRITYLYDDNGRQGIETVTVRNFYNNIHS